MNVVGCFALILIGLLLVVYFRYRFLNSTAIKLKKLNVSQLTFGSLISDRMIVMEYDSGQWNQPILKRYSSFKIEPQTAVFHYGQALFEGLKAYRHENGRLCLFRPLDNIKRLNKGAERLGMPMVPEEMLLYQLKKLVIKDKQCIPDSTDGSLYIRPMYFSTQLGVGVQSGESFRLIVFSAPVGPYYSKPLSLKVETQYSRAVEGGTGDVKMAGNYAGALGIAKKVKEQGYDDVLWTDALTHTKVEEASVMNVAFVINHTLVVPSLTSSLLGGVTRDSILQLAKDEGVVVEERDVTIDELQQAYKEGKLQEAMGFGTAAIVASIECLGFDSDKDIKLDVQAFKVGPLLKKKLREIQTGVAADKYHWNVFVN
jgi:branched-chain amino acid aminotransferase